MLARSAHTSFLVLTLSFLLCIKSQVHAQFAGVTSAPAPRILFASGLEWTTPVHPLRYFDATGRRAAVFGHQTGRFEAWVYPLKIIKSGRLEFHHPDYPEPIRGEAALEYLTVRPESTTLVYVHPHFTVRQTFWIPPDEPAVVINFDVDSDKPLAIDLRFIPEFKPMWPASLGGQYSYWSDDDKVLCLTDGTNVPTAVIGSPAVVDFTRHVNWSLIGGEMLLRLKFPNSSGGTISAPLVITHNMTGAKQTIDFYKSLIPRLGDLYAKRVDDWRDFLARTLTIQTPDAEVNRAFDWAKVAIHSGWVCHPKFGCGLIAGYGPADDSERPGFDWFFGGDALLCSWALEDYGDIAGAAQALRFLKAHQRADGKIIHELPQTADMVDWLRRYPFGFIHADTTPNYLYSLGQYWARTRDPAFLAEFDDSARKAYAYCLSMLDSNDALIDGTRAGLAAVEVGPLRGKVAKDVYLEGFWLGGLDAMLAIATAQKDVKLADDVRERLRIAAKSVNELFWDPKERTFTFGLTTEGKRADMIGNWSGVLLSLAPDQVDLSKRGAATAIFARPEISTDWGIRWLSNRDELYDPVSYNNGTAWPFMTGFCTWAQYINGHSAAGFSNLLALTRLTGAQSPGAMPEHMVGDRSLPGGRSVPHQLFSNVGLLLPLVRGLFGLSIANPPDSKSSTLVVAPRLPANWPRASFARYIVGKTRIDGEFVQKPNRFRINLTFDGPTPPLLLRPQLPFLSKVTRAVLDGKEYPFKIEPGDTGTVPEIHVASSKQRLELIIEHENGITFSFPTPPTPVGDSTTSLKILGIHTAHDTVELNVAGLGGCSYMVEVFTARKDLTADHATLARTNSGYHMTIAFEGAGYQNRLITLK